MSLLPYRPFYNEFDRPFWSNRLERLERDFFQPEFYRPNYFNSIVPKDFFGSDFFKPWDSMYRPWDDFMKPIENLTSSMNQLALREFGNIRSDDDKFQVNVDVQHFAPEEIKVKVTDGNVTIEGQHEEKKDDHGYIARRFVRQYSLPSGCLPDTVQSKLSSDGVLTVTAPKRLALPSIGERIVPIAHTGPVHRQIKFR